ncbi:hypothetical protein ACOKM5_12095 [Streptomyces sp. BH097]|uniref:hypothetical protein n=1 Tax=unclassified Streptomyces TaxID=2593676 RepID=UPI003BB52D07
MGVFTRFRRKASAADEASTAEAQAATLTAAPEAEDAEGPTEAPVAPTAEQEAAEAPADGEGAEAAAAEGVEIPKQQSAEQAADNEAGEGVRK